MSESTSEMLAHAEQALRLGDQLKAALLLHKILLLGPA